MQKCVLISTQPQWCELIACGKKLFEVRKTRPETTEPFKCYIYQTKMKWVFNLLKKLGFDKTAHTLSRAFGMVIGEFMCTSCEPFTISSSNMRVLSELSRVPVPDLYSYAKGKTLYGWRIKDPIIYDEPIPLSKFFRACNKEPGTDCSDCVYLGEHSCKSIKRPPQSWCYVESLDSNPRKMYLGNCEEGDCPHWSWCGDSYGDRNTELFCKLCKDTIYRGDVDEKPKIYCPLGKMFEED